MQPRKPRGAPDSTGGQYDRNPLSNADDLPCFDDNTIPCEDARAGDRIRALRERIRNAYGREPSRLEYAAARMDDASLRFLVESKRARSSQLEEWYARLDRSDPAWRYAQNMLAATRPGEPDEDHPDGWDWREQAVCDPLEELRIRERAVGSVNKPGSVLAAFLPYVDNKCDAVDMANQYLDYQLDGLRRSVAVDPTRCYSAPLVQSVVNQRVYVSRLLRLEPWRLSEHRMRVGMRYRKRCDQWRAEHHGMRPSASVRDRLWDENMRDFLNEKIKTGKSYGHGMTYSDGTNADPNSRAYRIVSELRAKGEWDDLRRRYDMGEPVRLPIRVDAHGKPVNGRADFETMLDDGLRHCGTRSLERMGETGFQVKAVDNDRLKDLFHTIHERGLDMDVAAQRLGVPKELTDRWRTEWVMGS